jgi:hypothetical protein
MPAPAPSHIEITETFVRLYVFLVQYLDRCLDEAARRTFPEHDLQQHLSATRARMMEIASANPVVKSKVEKECERVLGLGNACLTGGADGAARNAVLGERANLHTKTIALSDLLAVFRALAVT